jgi:hypothetical protein
MLPPEGELLAAIEAAIGGQSPGPVGLLTTTRVE